MASATLGAVVADHEHPQSQGLQPVGNGSRDTSASPVARRSKKHVDMLISETGGLVEFWRRTSWSNEGQLLRLKKQCRDGA